MKEKTADIDILEELIRDYKDEKEFVGEEIIKAIETLIAENKEQKRRMDEIKEIIKYASDCDSPTLGEILKVLEE